jgi:asparagine synthase (glutamine-hydrolysing)
MIFGKVTFPGIFRQSNDALSRIEKVITWEPSVSLHFSTGSLESTFITSPGIPFCQEDIFYHDAMTGTSVVMDGYLYNSDEISATLPGCDSSIPAPELVARAFHFRGPDFAASLNGDFALCISLEKQQQVYFYRDHVGIRPLAFARFDEAICFATDMNGLCKALFCDEPIDRQFLINLFLTGGHDYSLLPNRSVSIVKSGHYVRIKPDAREEIPYWFPERITECKSLTQPEVMQEAGQLLTDAVRIRSDLRFHAAAHVSGGLDSGTVATLAVKQYGTQSRFCGFSWSPLPDGEPDEISGDERNRVEAICRMNPIQPVYSGFEEEDYDAFVSEWRNPSELLFERKTVQAAKARGINLLFSGWGGDEFIGISDRGIDADLIRNLDWKSLIRKYNLLNTKGIISAIRYNTALLAARRDYSAYKTEKQVYPYLRKTLKHNRIPYRQRFFHRSRRDVHLQLLRKGHLSERTADWYVSGQRNGIEYRYPLLDYRIVEFMLKIPSHCLVRGWPDRLLLRDLGKEYLPPEVCRNSRKEDVAISRQFQKIVPDIKKRFINGMDEFRNNPELAFADFDRLRKNLPKIREKARTEPDSDYLSVFYYLKKAHEFTLGFHSPTR